MDPDIFCLYTYATREHIYPEITLLTYPIQVDVELDVKDGGHHKLTVDTQSEYVDISSLLIDGKVLFPNGDIQNCDGFGKGNVKNQLGIVFWRSDARKSR